MKKLHTKKSIILAIALLSFAPGACDEANEGDDPGQVTENLGSPITPEGLGLEGDWFVVEPGLWASIDEAGDVRHFGVGEAGKAHALTSLAEVAEELEAQAVANSEGQEALAELHAFIAETRAGAASVREDEEFLRCSYNVAASADAYPIACGAGAAASASYSHPCGTTKGTVKTYATATCAHLSETRQCGPYSADPAACSSNASRTGAGPCSSYAQVQIYGVYGVSIYLTDNNTQRGACGGGDPTTLPPPPPDDCPPHLVCHPK